MDEMIIKEIHEWFSRQPKWIGYVAEHLIDNNIVTSDDIENFSNLCLREIRGEDIGKQNISLGKLLTWKTDEKIYLQAIKNVEGINRLASNKTLNFEADKLNDTTNKNGPIENQDIVAVYGSNGAGKSGYIRLLKHICSARNPGELTSNIYNALPLAQRAIINFTEDGKPQGDEQWEKGKWDEENETRKKLSSVRIFDSSFGKIFIDKGGETSYEPPLLVLFTDIVNVCEKIQACLEKMKIEHTKIKILQYDEILKDTEEIKWFKSINAKTKIEEVEEHYGFNENDGNEIKILIQNPDKEMLLKECENNKTKKEYLKTLILLFNKSKNELSDEIFRSILIKKEEYKKLEEEAIAFNKGIIDENPLTGIGSEKWKIMWLAAKQYFEEEACKDSGHSKMSEGEYCMLCQQSIELVRARFDSFEIFMSHKKQKEAAQIKNEYLQSKKEIKDSAIPAKEHLDQTMELIGISDTEEIHSKIHTSFNQLKNRRDEFLKTGIFNSIEENSQWIEEANNRLEKLDDAEKNFKAKAENPDVEKNKTKLNRLQAREWLNRNKTNITEIIGKKIEETIFEKSISSTNTKKISSEKSKLSKSIITDPLKNKLNEELKKLGAKRIKVKIESETKKGHVFYKLVLYDMNEEHERIKISEILSEGENRIVSIAAFLADVTGEGKESPLVFDDPISSLDQKFEEKVIMRLVELSEQRQIIIFTHRLSLLYNLRSFVKKQDRKSNLNITSIREFNSVTGIPTPMLVENLKVKNALKYLITCCDEIEREFQNGAGKIEDDALRSACVGFRVTLERFIEEELFCRVLNRFEREVHSQELKNMKNIVPEDYKILDRMMSEYSKYVHSQPEDITNDLPDLKDFLDDVKEFKDWRDNYIIRPTILENSSQA